VTAAHSSSIGSQEKDMVELLLTFKGRMDEILEKSLAKSEAFANSLKVQRCLAANLPNR
jgi:hypothetical protein